MTRVGNFLGEEAEVGGPVRLELPFAYGIGLGVVA